jgi:poly(3-hydroxybutyrate) depolymerase
MILVCPISLEIQAWNHQQQRTEVARLRSTDGITQQACVVTRGSLQLQTWSNGQQGTRLAFATYNGGRHSWPEGDAKTPSAAGVIWSFFSGTTLR